MERTRKITFAGMFVALGLLLPLAFHMIGAGKAFLPMHIPVLLGGFLVGPSVGLVVGLVTPLLSSVLTGMPPMMPPVAPIMVLELGSYGLVGGLLYRRVRVNIVASLVVAMVAGRVVSGLGTAIAMPLFGFKGVAIWAPFTVGLVTSWPGILIQLVFVPTVVAAAQRTSVFSRNHYTLGDA